MAKKNFLKDKDVDEIMESVDGFEKLRANLKGGVNGVSARGMGICRLLASKALLNGDSDGPEWCGGWGGLPAALLAEGVDFGEMGAIPESSLLGDLPDKEIKGYLDFLEGMTSAGWSPSADALSEMGMIFERTGNRALWSRLKEMGVDDWANVVSCASGLNNDTGDFFEFMDMKDLLDEFTDGKGDESLDEVKTLAQSNRDTVLEAIKGGLTQVRAKELAEAIFPPQHRFDKYCMERGINIFSGLDSLKNPGAKPREIYTDEQLEILEALEECNGMNLLNKAAAAPVKTQTVKSKKPRMC